MRKILKQLLNDSRNLHMNSPKHSTSKKPSRYKGVGMATLKEGNAIDKSLKKHGNILLTTEELKARNLRFLNELKEE